MKLENKGFSLVELLIAVSISALVFTGVSAIIIMSMRLYAKGSVNAELQKNAQQAMEMVRGGIEDASGLYKETIQISSGEEYTVYFLGEFINGEEKGYTQYYDFSGNIIWYVESEQTLYYVSCPDLYYVPQKETKTDTMEDLLEYFIAQKTYYILADHVNSFEITLFDGSSDRNLDPTSLTFEEPLNMEVSLIMSSVAPGQELERNMEDLIRFRNRVYQIEIENTTYYLNTEE